MNTIDNNNNQPNVNIPNSVPNPLPNQSNPVQPIAPSSNNSQHNLMILLVIVAILFGVGGIIFAFVAIRPSKNTSPTTNQAPPPIITSEVATPTPNEDANKITDSDLSNTSGTTENEGYVLKDTLCYTIMIPKNNNAPKSNDCNFSYSGYVDTALTKELYVGSSITSDYHQYKDSQDMANQRMTIYKSTDDKVVSEYSLKIGGYSAYQVIVENGINRIQSSNIFIYIPDKYTNVIGYQTDGFEILTTFSDPDNAEEQKAEMNRMLASWQWK